MTGIIPTVNLIPKQIRVKQARGGQIPGEASSSGQHRTRAEGSASRLNSDWKKRKRSTKIKREAYQPAASLSAAVNPKALIPSVVRVYVAARACAAVRAHSAATPQPIRSFILISSSRVAMLYLGWRSSLSFFSILVETRRIFLAMRPLAIECPSGSAKT